MGAILSDFPQLPIDAHPQRVALYTRVYDDLTALGLALPVQPANTISRAQLLAHLQGLAGSIVKAELLADPESRYTALSDAQIANVISKEFAPNVASRFPGSNVGGYTVLTSTTAGLTAEMTGGGVPNFDTLLFDVTTGNMRASVYLRFRNSTTTVALRGKFGRIDDAPSASALTFAIASPIAPPAGNVFDIGYLRPVLLIPRLAEILRRLPHSPNELTTADITAAKA
jgi:hypothetical protein